MGIVESVHWQAYSSYEAINLEAKPTLSGFILPDDMLFHPWESGKWTDVTAGFIFVQYVLFCHERDTADLMKFYCSFYTFTMEMFHL